MEMACGAALLITGGYPVSGMGDTFKIFGQGYVDGWNIVPTPIVVMFIFLLVRGSVVASGSKAAAVMYLPLAGM